MKKIVTLLSFAILAACSPDADTTGEAMPKAMHDQSAHQGIIVSNAWVRPPLPGRDIATAYFDLTNHNAAADRLVSVSSGESSRVEIHTHLNEDGVMKMRRIDGLDLPVGEAVTLKPGGLHIMMFETVMTEDQKDASLTLNFENSESVTIIAEVNASGQPMKTDHSGH